MINAYEARKRTSVSNKLKSTMTEIEKAINESIERGWYYAYIVFPTKPDSTLIEILTKELESLGYGISYYPEEPCPAGCRSDQWYSENRLEVSWSESED